MTLRKYPSLGLADARTLATTYRELLDKDVDPRRGEITEQKQITFHEIAELWHQKNTHRWKPVTSNRHRKSLERDIYPFIGDKSINEITKSDLLKIIHPHEIKGHHEVTHRLHDRLETIFDFAVGVYNSYYS